MKPTRALALVRIAVGAIFLVRTTPLLLPFGFRFAEFPLLGFPDGRWRIALLALPAWSVAVLAIARTLACLSFLVGYRARAAGVIAALCGYVVLSQDALAYVNSLQLLYLSTCLVALTDCSTELAVRREPPRSIASSVWLVRAIPLSVYAFSALAKMNAQFWSGDALLGFCVDELVAGPVAGILCATQERAHLASMLVVTVEIALPCALAWRRTRRVALIAAVIFHATLEISMHPDVFGWLMLALLVSFAVNAEPLLSNGASREIDLARGRAPRGGL